jgi:hypothetical protein
MTVTLVFGHVRRRWRAVDRPKTPAPTITTLDGGLVVDMVKSQELAVHGAMRPYNGGRYMRPETYVHCPANDLVGLFDDQKPRSPPPEGGANRKSLVSSCCRTGLEGKQPAQCFLIPHSSHVPFTPTTVRSRVPIDYIAKLVCTAQCFLISQYWDPIPLL